MRAFSAWSPSISGRKPESCRSSSGAAAAAMRASGVSAVSASAADTGRCTCDGRLAQPAITKDSNNARRDADMLVIPETVKKA